MTFANFVSDMAGLVVAGVYRRFDAPPSQLSTAMLPAQYPRLPEGNVEVVSFTGATGLLNVICELVIVVSAIGQDNNPPNFDLTVTLMSALDIALRAVSADGAIDRWTMTATAGSIGIAPYWMIVARVEASG